MNLEVGLYKGLYEERNLNKQIIGTLEHRQILNNIKWFTKF